jgi:hypothetical protein
MVPSVLKLSSTTTSRAQASRSRQRGRFGASRHRLRASAARHRTTTGSRTFAALLEHRFQLVEELGHVLELAIHGSESHIGNLVQLTKLFDDQLADHLGGHFLVERLGALPLEAIDHGFELLDGDRALLAGLEQAAEDLLALVRNPSAVLLDHPQHGLLDPFVGGVAALALQTLAPTADDEGVAAATGVDDPVVVGFAEGATHGGRRWRYGGALGAGKTTPQPDLG